MLSALVLSQYVGEKKGTQETLYYDKEMVFDVQ